MSHFPGYNNGPGAKNTSRVRKRKHRAADPDSDDSQEGHNAHRDHLGPSEGIGLGSTRGKGPGGRGGGGGRRGAHGTRRGPPAPSETALSPHSRPEWEQPQAYGHPYPPSSSSTSSVSATTFYPTNVHDPLLSSSSAPSQGSANPLRHLYYRAYEADLIQSAESESIARSLEVDADGRPFPASALVRWGGGGVGTTDSSYGSKTGIGLGAGLGRGVSKSREGVVGASAGLRVEDDEDESFDGGFGGEMSVEDAGARQEIWVDRYDIRLLLDTLPETTTGREIGAGTGDVPRPDSPAGWSDLSSDVEDTFFFSPAEAEDFHYEKRQKAFADAREARMKALEEEERAALGQPPEDAWGGSDEEPDEDEKQLMRRTAAHLASAEDSAQLEIRILANFGGDKRFAFLRGRWSRAWKLVLAHARQEKQAKERPHVAANKPALGGLAGYGSESDSDTNSVKESGSALPTDKTDPKGLVGSPDAAEDERKKEARRQRAKAWAESRKNQASSVADST